MRIRKLRNGGIKMTAQSQADRNILLKMVGQKFTKYQCPSCKRDIETRQPDQEQVSEKGYWDSLKVCPHCFAQAFVLVWPSGETEVRYPV